MLPDDILLIILKYLPSSQIQHLSALNKRFYYFVNDPHLNLYSQLNLDENSSKLLQHLCKHKKQTQTFTVNISTSVSVDTLNAFYTSLELYLQSVVRNGQKIKLMITAVDANQLIKLFVKYYYKTLECIQLQSWNDYDDDQIDLKSVKYISKCSNLTTFINNQIWGIPLKGLELIAKLQNLSILKITTVNLQSQEFISIIKQIDRVKELKFTNFRNELLQHDKDELLYILSRHEHLQTLELDWEMTNFQDGFRKSDLSVLTNLSLMILILPIEAFLPISESRQEVSKTKISASSHSFTRITKRSCLKIKESDIVQGDLEYFKILYEIFELQDSVHVEIYGSF